MDRSLRNVPAITRAAVEAGHEPSITREGTRFRIVCTCGWQTPLNLSRKATFQAITDHIEEVARPLLAEVREVAAGSHQSVGGRA